MWEQRIGEWDWVWRKIDAPKCFLCCFVLYAALVKNLILMITPGNCMQCKCGLFLCMSWCHVVYTSLCWSQPWMLQKKRLNWWRCYWTWRNRVLYWGCTLSMDRSVQRRRCRLSPAVPAVATISVSTCHAFAFAEWHYIFSLCVCACVTRQMHSPTILLPVPALPSIRFLISALCILFASLYVVYSPRR